MEEMINMFLNKMKEIQGHILKLIDNEDNYEENMQNLKISIEDHKIRENRNEFKMMLRLLLKISNNHYRSSSFYNKIDQILKYLTKEIKEYFTNSEIFDIFKSNKRILLFLLKEEIFHFDLSSSKVITTTKYINRNYPQYFAPEIKPFIKNGLLFKIDVIRSINNELPEDFEDKREKAENDNFICQLIHNDSIDEFVQYVNRYNFPLEANISESIYETNSYLLKKESSTLIEYAAFHNAIQIFNFLSLNNVKLNECLWE